jgi:hypothetical protein
LHIASASHPIALKIEREKAMEWFSVVSRLRLRVAIQQQRHVALLLTAALALSPLACGESNGPTSPSGGTSGGGPPTSAAQEGFIDGTVRDSSGVVAGALVEVTAAPGGSATTSTGGVFSFKLPVGITRLRATKSGYYPRESDVIVKAGAVASLEILLDRFENTPPVPRAPYTVKGVVRNGRGAVVPGAEVWIYGNSSPIDNNYGITFSDGAGQYSVTSPQRVPQAVRAMNPGHITRDVSILSFPDGSTWTVDVVLAHIDRYTFVSIPPLAVGQSVQLQAQVDLDDGSTKTGFLFGQITSSDPSVLQGSPSGGWVKGVAPGTATVTGSYYGVTTTLQIRVQ